MVQDFLHQQYTLLYEDPTFGSSERRAGHMDFTGGRQGGGAQEARLVI